jgi:hypothetical protein
MEEGKWEVSWVERVEMDMWERMEERGKRVAWVSGAVKGRHLRQLPAAWLLPFDVGALIDVVLPILGFEASCAAESLGREDSGMGGGSVGVGVDSTSFNARPGLDGRAGATSVALFIPISNADRRGLAGCNPAEL